MTNQPLRFAALLAALLAAALLLGGCSMSNRGYSGFLGDYSRLKPDPDIKGVLVYRAPGFDAGGYDKFIVDPIGVHFAPDAKGTAINPDKLKELTDYFHQKLTEELSANYSVVLGPGPGTMRLRIAITDIKKTEPALNIHPATKLSGAGLGGASVEAEGIDTATGQRLFAFVHTRPGDRLAITEGLEAWGHAKQAMDFWAKKLVERLDKAHGIAPAK